MHDQTRMEIPSDGAGTRLLEGDCVSRVCAPGRPRRSRRRATSCVTTAPAPTSAPSPMRTPASTTAPEPIDARSSTCVVHELPVRLRLRARRRPFVARGRLSLMKIDAVADEDLVADVDAVADERVALDLAPLADRRSPLDLHERPDGAAAADRAAVEIRERPDAYLLSEGDVVEEAVWCVVRRPVSHRRTSGPPRRRRRAAPRRSRGTSVERGIRATAPPRLGIRPPGSRGARTPRSGAPGSG